MGDHDRSRPLLPREEVVVHMEEVPWCINDIVNIYLNVRMISH
jgi:hypothetical protein